MSRVRTACRLSAVAALALMLAAPVAAAPQAMPAAPAASSPAAAAMTPYVSTIGYPVPKDTLMIMLLPDFQVARTTDNFFTGMVMLEYGVTSQWTVGLMAEGQKIPGLPLTYGGLRFNTYVRLFPHDDVLHFTLYAEYEDLNGAALYKMEVAGFGGENLEGPLDVARRTPVRTFEQRAIMYHDWGRVNLTFNVINETGIDEHGNDLGYAWGLFRQASWTGMEGMTGAGMEGMTGTATPDPPRLSWRRLGYGIEMIGALGDTHQFALHAANQQQYFGPVFTYAMSPHWTLSVEPAFGLSAVSDHFVLRMGVGRSIAHLTHAPAHKDSRAR